MDYARQLPLLYAFICYSLLWSLRRFGLLASLASVAAMELVLTVPLGFTSWYAGRSVITLVIPVTVAAWALWAISSAQQRPGSETAG
jgi:hypothetical protein